MLQVKSIFMRIGFNLIIKVKGYKNKALVRERQIKRRYYKKQRKKEKEKVKEKEV